MGDKAETIASTKILFFFIAVAQALWLLWQLKIPLSYNGKCEN